MTTKNKIPTIAKDEQATLGTTVDGNKVTTTHTCKPNGDSAVRYNLIWTFDFANVSQEEILRLAERTLTIKMQNEWRKAKDRENAAKWHGVTFNVRDILDAARKTTDPVAKAANAIEKLTPEEKKALLAQLQAE